MASKKPVKKSKPAAKRPAERTATIPMKTITPPHVKENMAIDSCCSTDGGCCGSSKSFCHILALYTKSNTWFMAFAAAFTLWAMDFLWHGMLLMPRYLETALLWRPEAQIAELWPYCLAYHGIYGFVFTSTFLLMGGNTLLKGFKNGILIAAPLATSTLMVYVTNAAIPVDLLQMWAAGYLLQGAVTGIVLTTVAHWACKNEGCCGGGCNGGSCC